MVGVTPTGYPPGTVRNLMHRIRQIVAPVPVLGGDCVQLTWLGQLELGALVRLEEGE